jgi:hypothetical protein
MRDYLFVFFDGSLLPSDVYANWRRWQAEYEQVWRDTVRETMEAGDEPVEDPVVATRLILGMTIWVAQWYRPEEGFTQDQISEHAIGLLRGLLKNR